MTSTNSATTGHTTATTDGSGSGTTADVWDGAAGAGDNVRGKVVLITGASSGLGEALARRLAERGARLVLAARRADRLSKLVDAVTAAGGEAASQVTDVSDKNQVAALVETAVASYGHIDVLVNNAAIMPASPYAKNDTQEWDRLIDINIKGVLYTVGAVLPHMHERGSGHIINVSSVAAYHPGGTVASVYAATKHAVRVITEGLRAEEAAAGSGVRVTEMAPGAIDTDLKYTVTDPQMRRLALEAYEPGSPMLSAEDMASGIVYAIGQPEHVTVATVVVAPTGAA